MNQKRKILVVFGTRPEAVKMAPVVKQLREHSELAESRVCVTGQHREMLDQVLGIFGLVPDYDLNIMSEDQSLASVSARVLMGLDEVFENYQPDWVLVQGDTTTAMATSLAAFYRRIKVGHVEAGLRTYDKFQPFPEEINRQIVDALSDLHFAPTERACQNLRREGVPDSSIRVTGNTVIDAMLWVREHVRRLKPRLPEGLARALPGNRLILVTGHRRESFGAGLEQICLAIREIAERFRDVLIVYPVHLNPNVQEPVRRILGGLERVMLVTPLPYATFAWLMDRCHLILTDSGGVQEEAPSLGKPVLVMREVTERPEGIEAGNASLVGTGKERIVRETSRLLNDTAAYNAMAEARNPYGDGHAAERIVEAILRR
jgi:UDP-N-acetylglucosamine 2-epimerase (non-hydrolysing)